MLRKFIFRVLMNGLAFYVAAWLFPQIKLGSLSAVMLAALALALINLIVRPLILLLTLPINFLTLGLYTLVINAWMVMLADKMVSGLDISGFWHALFISVLIFIGNLLFKPFFKRRNN